MFEGNNLTRGWWSEFAPKRDEDEPDLSDYEEKLRKCDKRNKAERQKQVKATAALPKKAGGPGPRSAPSIQQAHKAASALSRGASQVTTSRTAAPTASAKAQVVQPGTKRPMFDRGNPRFTAAKAASNSTIGYSKGRVVSATRRPMLDLHAAPGPTNNSDKLDTKDILNQLLNIGSLDIDDDRADLGFDDTACGLDLLVHDEEPEVFQLDPVQHL